MLKSINQNTDWIICDQNRMTGSYGLAMKANTADIEGNLGEIMFESDGFSFGRSNTDYINQAGQEYMFVAIAKSRALTNNRRLDESEVNNIDMLFSSVDYRKAKHEQELVNREAELRALYRSRGYADDQIDDVLD